METISLDVYVQTVEGILSASSTFTYSGAQTPLVNKMSHVVWATGTFSLSGKTCDSDPSHFTVRIGNYRADLADPSVLNSLTFSPYSSTSLVNYYPPADMPCGFGNLSFTTENSELSIGPGLARMFPDKRPVDYAYDFTYGRNFDSTISGTAFSICLLPVIISISPAIGSLAGGTIVTILGHGFPFNTSLVTVFTSGQICDVTYADVNKLLCTTRSVVPARLEDEVAMFDRLLSDETFSSNTTRPFGSSGCWVTMWDALLTNYISTPSEVAAPATISFPWRNGLSFSMWYDFGYRWWSSLGLANADFTAEITTVMIVPLTGNYTFFVNADDEAYVYGNNQLLARASSERPDTFFTLPSQRSRPVFLKRGSRFFLRVKTASGHSAFNFHRQKCRVFVFCFLS